MSGISSEKNVVFVFFIAARFCRSLLYNTPIYLFYFLLVACLSHSALLMPFARVAIFVFLLWFASVLNVAPSHRRGGELVCHEYGRSSIAEVLYFPAQTSQQVG